MHLNEKRIEMNEKSLKNQGVLPKNAHISVAKCPRVPNLVLN